MNYDVNSNIPIDLFESIYLTNKNVLKNKYMFLGEGASRLVLAIDDNYVVKLSKGKTGNYQCKTENYIYSNIREQNKKYFCPIIWYKKGMVVMPRAVPFSQIVGHRHGSVFEFTNIKPTSAFFQNIKKIAKHYDLLYPDIKAISSWGLLDNKPVLIDYGCTNKLYDNYFY